MGISNNDNDGGNHNMVELINIKHRTEGLIDKAYNDTYTESLKDDVGNSSLSGRSKIRNTSQNEYKRKRVYFFYKMEIKDLPVIPMKVMLLTCMENMENTNNQ